MRFGHGWEQEEAMEFLIDGLCEAINKKDATAVQQLLATGADPNVIWDAHVHHRPGLGCVVGVDPSAGIECGGRPLQEACVRADTRIANILIDYGANMNARNVLGRTVLHQVAYLGELEMACLLIHRGAKLDVRCERRTPENDGSLDKGLATPLYDAVRRCRYEMAALFLESGASPDIPSEDGDTALDVLLERFQDEAAREMMSKLILRGATLDRRSTTKRSPEALEAVLHADLTWI